MARGRVGVRGPVTGGERGRRGETGEFGFIARYREGVVYPEEFTTVLRIGVAVMVAIAYRGWFRRRAPRLGPI